jgi:hypothetical protein
MHLGPSITAYQRNRILHHNTAGWFVNMFEIASSDPKGEVLFAQTESYGQKHVKGGWQGGRGWQVNASEIDDPNGQYLLARCSSLTSSPPPTNYQLRRSKQEIPAGTVHHFWTRFCSSPYYWASLYRVDLSVVAECMAGVAWGCACEAASTTVHG